VKEVLIAMAEYNAGADKKLVEILNGVDGAILREDQRTYYKSIIGTLEHIAGATVNTLKRFNGYFTCRCLASNPLITGDFEALKKGLHDNPAAVYDLLSKGDTLFVDFARDLDAANLHKRVSYTNYKGLLVEREYWNMIFHILNHSTHHRGEISAMLDRKGIANDFSGFTLYTK